MHVHGKRHSTSVYRISYLYEGNLTLYHVYIASVRNPGRNDLIIYQIFNSKLCMNFKHTRVRVGRHEKNHPVPIPTYSRNFLYVKKTRTNEIDQVFMYTAYIQKCVTPATRNIQRFTHVL